MEHGASPIGRSGDIHLAATFDRNKIGDVRRIQRNLMPRSRNHYSHGNVRVSSLGIVVEIYVAVNKTEVFIVSKQLQQQVPFALQSSYKIFRTALNNTNVFIFF